MKILLYKLVTDGLNFPSNDYIYYGLERQGARICQVASPDGISVPIEHMLNAIDEEPSWSRCRTSRFAARLCRILTQLRGVRTTWVRWYLQI